MNEKLKHEPFGVYANKTRVCDGKLWYVYHDGLGGLFESVIPFNRNQEKRHDIMENNLCDFDVSEFLKTQEEKIAYINDLLKDNDVKLFLNGLGDLVKTSGKKEEIIKLVEAFDLSDSAFPVNLLFKIMKILNLQFKIEPEEKPMKEITVKQFLPDERNGTLKEAKVIKAYQIKDIPWIKPWERNFLFHCFSVKSVAPFSADGNTYTLMVEFANSVIRYKPIATIIGATDEEILKVFHIFEGS